MEKEIIQQVKEFELKEQKQQQ